MKKELVIVPTTDEDKVHIGHFGEAKYYMIIDCRTHTPEAKITNPFHNLGHEDESSEKGKRKAILGKLRQHQASKIIMTAMGPGGKEFFEKHGFKVIGVKPGTTIEDAVNIACKIWGKSPN